MLRVPRGGYPMALRFFLLRVRLGSYCQQAICREGGSLRLQKALLVGFVFSVGAFKLTALIFLLLPSRFSRTDILSLRTYSHCTPD